jgi:hypothetical protein
MSQGGAMRIKLAVCGLVGALLLAATAPADIQARTLKGTVVGDENSAVSIKVVLKNGKPKRLKGLTYENLDAYCDPDGSFGPQAPEYVGEVSGSAGRNRGPRIEVGGYFDWFSYPESPSRQVTFAGRLKNGGKKAVGNIGVFNNESCENAEGRAVLLKT